MSMGEQTWGEPAVRLRPDWGIVGWGLGAAVALLPVVYAMARYPAHMVRMAVALPALALVTGAVLYRPAWGACGLILLVYWNASDVITATFGFSWLLKIAIAGVLAAWMLDRWLHHQNRPLRWPLLVPLLVWGGAQMLCAATGVSRSISGTQLVEYAKILAVFYLVVNLLPTPRWWRWGIDALLAAVLLLSLPVLFQGLTGSHFTFWGFGSMEYAATAPGQFGWRLGGALGDPNFLAMMLVAALPLAALQALGPRLHWARRLWAVGVLGAATGAILFTYSRGGIIGIVVMIAALLVAHPRRKWVLTATLAGIVLATAAAPGALWGRLDTLVKNSLGAQEQQMTDASFRDRRHEIVTGWIMFVHHPLVGVGPGNFETAYLKYSAMAGLSGEDVVRDPHSLYTQLLAETGLIGAAAFIFLMWAAFRLLERGRQRTRRLGAEAMATLLAAFELSLIVYLVCSIFLHDAYFRHFFLLLALGALGAGLALEGAPTRRRRALAGSGGPALDDEPSAEQDAG